MSRTNPTTRSFMSLVACGLLLGVTSTATAALKVVATLTDLAAIAQEVGGDRVEVMALAAATEDPHYVEPKPSFIVALNKADMLIVNGLELEVGWLPPLQSQARNPAINKGGAGFMDVSAFVPLLEKQTGKLSRGEGDVHSGGNPHYTFSPKAGARIAAAIANHMARLDPEGEPVYLKRAVSFANELLAFALAERERFDALSAEKRRVVTYHRSLVYVHDWLGLTLVTNIEPKPGIPPNPGHVATVLQTMKTQKVTLILQENFYPQKTSQTLARLAGARLIVLDGGTRFKAGERYIDHLKKISEALYNAIQG